MCFEAINQQLAWTLPQGPTRHEWAEVAELYKEEDLGAPQSHSWTYKEPLDSSHHSLDGPPLGLVLHPGGLERELDTRCPPVPSRQWPTLRSEAWWWSTSLATQGEVLDLWKADVTGALCLRAPGVVVSLCYSLGTHRGPPKKSTWVVVAGHDLGLIRWWNWDGKKPEDIVSREIVWSNAGKWAVSREEGLVKGTGGK